VTRISTLLSVGPILRKRSAKYSNDDKKCDVKVDAKMRCINQWVGILPSFALKKQAQGMSRQINSTEPWDLYP